MEVAHQYYKLSETKREVALTKKRLREELDDTRIDKAQKRVKRAQLNEAESKDAETDFQMRITTNKYNWSGVIEAHNNRQFLEMKITLLEYGANIIESVDISIATARRAVYTPSAYINEKRANISVLREELHRLPYTRPLFVVPASTLPLSLHPKRNKLCLRIGTALTSDIWEHLLFAKYITDKATLRLLRLTCVSLAILVHSLPSDVTGFTFCI